MLFDGIINLILYKLGGILMIILKNAIMYFLTFKPYVMLPVIIFILAMVFRIKISIAIKSALSIGIGFVGIFIIFDYFVKIINPVVQALITRAGLHFNVLDVGWPPLASITWSFQLAPILILVFMVVNILMLIFKLTKTVDIDIWNYWHFIFVAALVFGITGSYFLAVVASIVTCIIVIKIADWSAPMVQKLSGMEGICIPTLSAAAYFPIGLLGDKLIDKIPILNKIDANPEKLQKKLGIIAEPMILGFIVGIGLGIGGGYNVKEITDLAFSFAAVTFILPKMCNIVGSSLLPISAGMKYFINNHFPNMGETYIGLDVAVIVGLPSVVVTAIFLTPVALLLAFILPGINFIPLGDLTNIIGSIALVCVATKGNVIRSFIIGIPILIGSLYVASNMASLYTRLAHSVHYKIAGYNGTFTSFLDGGNMLRAWIVKLFCGNIYAIILLPVIILILFITRRITTRESIH